MLFHQEHIEILKKLSKILSKITRENESLGSLLPVSFQNHIFIRMLKFEDLAVAIVVQLFICHCDLENF